MSRDQDLIGAGIAIGLQETVPEKHLSVKAAAEAFGYNEEYLRCLLRAGPLQGVKISWVMYVVSHDSH
jgi:hypothetical protein